MNNAETINLIAVIVLGLVAIVALIALSYGKRKGDDTLVAALGPYQAFAEMLAGRLDTVLAQYGDLLKPVYDLSSAAETLIDEPTDFVRKLLPDDVTAIAQEVLKYMKTLSDGQPPIPEGGEGPGEAQPLGEVKRE
jgi:hypothetical protein